MESVSWEDIFRGEKDEFFALESAGVTVENTEQRQTEYLVVGSSGSELKPQEASSCRHIFITAAHSRAPLDCSEAFLQHLWKDHQIDDAFLKLLAGGFHDREQAMPGDLCQFSPVTNKEGSVLKRWSLLLLAPEMVFKPKGSGPWSRWSLRQAALHYFFNETNRATLFVHVKGSGEGVANLQERVKSLSDSASGCSVLQVYLDWCVEKLPDYVSEFEAERIKPGEATEMMAGNKRALKDAERCLGERVISGTIDQLSALEQRLLVVPSLVVPED